MLETDDGVVLSTSRSGETSLIATFLGRRTGKVKLMGKGILAPKHPSRGLFQVGNHLSVLFYFKPDRTLYFIKETSLASPPPACRDSLQHLAALMAAMEILDQVCYPGSADEAVVDTAVDYIRCADAADPLLLFLAFEIKLLESLGVAPELSSCTECGRPLDRGVFVPALGATLCGEHAGDARDGVPVSAETIAAGAACRSDALEDFARLTISRAARKELGKIVHGTYTHHVAGYQLPRSLNLI